MIFKGLNINPRGLLPALVIILMTALIAQPAAADDNYEFIVITKARQKIRVAVPTFRTPSGSDQIGEEAAAITESMRETVRMTGLFELIPPDSYPDPIVPGGEENFSAWSLIRTDLLIRGDMAPLGSGRYQVELRLYDVKQKKMVLGKRYTGARDMLSRMSLRFMDEILGWLTPKKGALDARIAYVTDRSRRDEIHVMDTDGSHDQAITTNRTMNLSPAWSRDGRYLVYTGYRARNPDLYIADLVENRTWRFFAREGLNNAAEFSPDGRMVAFNREAADGNIDIYLMELGSKKLRRITTAWSVEVSPTWSPDGRYLAFVSDRTGSPQVYILDLSRGPETSNNPAVRITQDGSYNTSPAWSPDGRWIAYTGRVGGQFDLFLIDMGKEGKNVRRLTATIANEEDPTWSPDSRFLVYASNKYGNYDIFLMSIYGGSPKRLTTSPAKDRMPAWSPRTEP